MSIYFNRGQVGKGGYSGQAPNNPRGSPSGDSKANEVTSAEEQLFATTSAASESGMQAAIMSQPVDPIHVKRAVEEANELAQTQLSRIKLIELVYISHPDESQLRFART